MKSIAVFDLSCIPANAVINSIKVVNCQPTGELPKGDLPDDYEDDDENEYW